METLNEWEIDQIIIKSKAYYVLRKRKKGKTALIWISDSFIKDGHLTQEGEEFLINNNILLEEDNGKDENR